MIVPVNVAPQSLQLPVQSQSAARQQTAGLSAPDLSAAPSLKKSGRLQARSTATNPGQSSFHNMVASGSSLAQDFLQAADRPATSVVDRTVAAASQAAHNLDRTAEPQLLAQASPGAPASNGGLPADVPPLDTIPTLQPQNQQLPAVPTTQPESVTPQSGGNSPSQPPADGVGQSFPPPSEVLPQENLPPRPTGVPPQEPANYLNNQPGNVAPFYNQNYIGPAISFGRDTVVGAVSRFGWGKNISVRPSLFLGNTTRIAVPVTYDFDLNNNEQFETNPLVVFHAGGGLDYSSGGGSNGSRLNPLVVAGADIYFGDGASVLLQVGSAFDSNFVGVVGVGLQF